MAQHANVPAAKVSKLNLIPSIYMEERENSYQLFNNLCTYTVSHEKKKVQR